MRYLICTRQDFVGNLMRNYLLREGFNASLARNTEDLERLVLTYGKDKYDLAIVDYTLYDHTEKNLYKVFSDNKIPIPIFFFNDPYVSNNTRIMYSLQKNLLYFGEFITSEEMERYRPFMEKVMDYVTEPERRKFINLMSDPVPFGGPTLSRNFRLEEFKRKYDIKASRFHLLQFFVNNQNEIITPQAICKVLWGDEELTEKRQRNIYCYVHDLREIFAQEEAYSIKIDSEGKGCYSFHLNPGMKYISALRSTEEAIEYRNKVSLKEYEIRMNELKRREADIEEREEEYAEKMASVGFH